MNLKKLLRLAINNYIISIFIACIIFVGFVSIYKVFFAKSTYVYAKVKLGQGLWWASTQKPSYWLVKAIKKGDQQRDFAGNPIVEVLKVQYYPWSGLLNQFDVYLTLKIKVTGNKKTGEYNFNRSTIGISSPIDLEFPSTQISGTIIQLSNTPITDQYINKTITLTKQYGYPWEYDAIKKGDKYFDGENVVFEVLDKNASNDNQVIIPERGSVINPELPQTRQYITVKAKLLVKKMGDQLIFGDDQIISMGKSLFVATPNFTFQDYIIGGIE